MIDTSSPIDLSKFPICVDLDGTLWAGDCLWLCAKQFLKKNPLGIFQLVFWWLKGRTVLKRKLLTKVSFDPASLNYFPEILKFVVSLKEQGAKTYLVTGSDQEIADKVSAHLNIFDAAFGSCIGNNLVGENKATLLNKLFGKKNYVYFGNEWKDQFVWQYCAAIVAVNTDARTQKWVDAQDIYSRRFICKPTV